MKTILSILILSVVILSMKADAGTEKILMYKQGDEVPVNLVVKGDLAETEEDSAVYVTVKRTFFLKETDSGTFVSFDGNLYKPYQQVISETLSISALGADPSPISVILDASIK